MMGCRGGLGPAAGGEGIAKSESPQRMACCGDAGIQQLDSRPFKNAIDWLSRSEQENDEVFAGKPVAVIGAIPRRLWHPAQPKRVAARAPHAGDAAMVWRPPPRLAGRSLLTPPASHGRRREEKARDLWRLRRLCQKGA